MAGAACIPTSYLSTASASKSLRQGVAIPTRTGAGICASGWYRDGGWCCQPLVHTATNARPEPFSVCRASDHGANSQGQGFGKPINGKLAEAKRYQLEATEVLAELLKSDNVQFTAQKYLDSLTEEFFMIASTYLEMAKKEGNAEIVNKIETSLQIAMAEKGKTLRPEIRLMNQLLNETSTQERAKAIQSNQLYLDPDGYFFELLERMTADVERQQNNPKRKMLLSQLQTITKEAKEAAKTFRRAKWIKM